MHKRGLCCHAVSVCLSVRPSITFVDHVKTNKRIFEIFSQSGSDTILVFPYQRGCRYSDGNPPDGGIECRWVGKKRVSGQICGCIGHWCLQHLPRNADCSISWSSPCQFAPNSHAVFYWGTAILERSPISKKRFLNVEFCRRKTVITFLRCINSKFAAVSKINKWHHTHFVHALSCISSVGTNST